MLVSQSYWDDFSYSHYLFAWQCMDCCKETLMFFFFYYVVSLEPDFVKDEPCGCNKDPVPQCGCCGKFEFDGKDHSGKQFQNKCYCIFSKQTLPQWAVRGLDPFTFSPALIAYFFASLTETTLKILCCWFMTKNGKKHLK